jgi:hypothetical protein
MTGLEVILIVVVVVLVLIVLARGGGGTDEGGGVARRLTLPKIDTRTFLALGVVVISIVGVIFLAITNILVAEPGERRETTNQVLSAVLPLLGTWVGTVMAYYFTRENYEAAAENTRSTFQIARTAEEILQSTPAVDKMLRWNDTIFYKKLGDKPLADAQKDVNLVALLTELDQRGNAVGKKWNRIPILTHQNFPLYVIHRSLITEFIAKQSAAGRAANEIQAVTLQDMFSDPQFQMTLIQSISVLNEKATLAEAKEAMSKTPNCQDVFVTRGGTRNEEILGWLTNIDIEQAGKV